MNKTDLEHQAYEIGIDINTLTDLYKVFFEQTENDIFLLESFITSKNIQKIKESAHHIKGACLSLELKTLAELAREMEVLSDNKSWDEISSLLKLFTDTMNEVKLFFNKGLK